MEQLTFLLPLSPWLNAHQNALSRGFLWIKVTKPSELEGWLAALKQWSLATASTKQPATVCVVSDQKLPNSGDRFCAPLQAHSILGHEFDLVVYDGFAGVNPDAIAQVTGTVKGGGLFVFFSPDDKSPAFYADPEKERIKVYPFSVAEVGDAFLNHMARWLNTCKGLAIINGSQPNGALERSPACTLSVPTTLDERLDEQKKWVVATEDLILTQPFSAHVLLADRGRGKSSALGLLARSLIEQGLSVCVVAPTKGAVKALYHHSNQSEPTLSFYTPVDLYLALDKGGVDQKYTVLLVDEAASIALNMLEAFKNRFPHVIYATTVSGYEGTGQGFRLRFLKLAQQQWNARVTTLKKPIRWAEGDTLEEAVKKGLFLDQAQSCDSNDLCETVSIRAMAAAKWCQSPELLQQTVALLSEAHYRTTPSDIRIIMDSPNIRTWVAESDGQVVGVIVVAEEGPLPEDLVEAIWQGRRRPKGHLFPQTLIAQQGFKEAGQLSFWRVVRIAVLPNKRRQGTATMLLNSVRCAAKARSIDVIGASFSMTDALLRFWELQGMSMLRLGAQLDKTAGGYAALMGQALSHRAQALCTQWQGYARSSYPIKKEFWLNHLDLPLQRRIERHVEHLPHSIGGEDSQTWLRDQLDGFAHHHRSWEASLYPLSIWLESQTGLENHLGLLIGLSSQKRAEWATPNKAALRQLREHVAALLKQNSERELTPLPLGDK
jgi:tRNA(Met) cytidine acetyltransferase